MKRVQEYSVVTLQCNDYPERTYLLSNTTSSPYTKLSPETPLGRAIIGCAVGDMITIGNLKYKILDIVEYITKDKPCIKNPLGCNDLTNKISTSYQNLIKIIKEIYPDFKGLVHATEFENFINIMKSGYLKSRSDLEKDNQRFVDEADQSVIDKTDVDVKACCRFYYREKTPTYYRAGYQRPVIIVFDEQLLLDSRAVFCNMNAAKHKTISYGTQTYEPIRTNNIADAIDFNWEEILQRGPYDSTLPGLKDFKNAFRNCDFLIRGNVSKDKIIGIVFCTEKDKLEAERILGPNNLFVIKPEMFD